MDNMINSKKLYSSHTDDQIFQKCFDTMVRNPVTWCTRNQNAHAARQSCCGAHHTKAQTDFAFPHGKQVILFHRHSPNLVAALLLLYFNRASTHLQERTYNIQRDRKSFDKQHHGEIESGFSSELYR